MTNNFKTDCLYAEKQFTLVEIAHFLLGWYEAITKHTTHNCEP